MKKIFLFFMVVFFSFGVKAQQPNYEEFVPISGEQNPYEKKAINERPVIAYPYLQEADVKYHRKVFRIIDSRQKMNKILEWPKNPLSLYIHGYATGYFGPENTVKAYMSTSDSLYTWMSTEDAKEVGSNEITITIQPDPEDPFYTYDSVINVVFDHYMIRKYMLMEDWFFDHKHSVFKPRIYAIAPMYEKTFGGQIVGEYPMFWLKMEELRPLLKNVEMFNVKNDAARISYDHFFQYRMFDSYIVKESNMYDQFIKDYEMFKDDNMAALLESERIKNDLFIWEHDLWEY